MNSCVNINDFNVLVYDVHGRARLMHNIRYIRLSKSADGARLTLRFRDGLADKAERIVVNFAYNEFFSGYILSQSYSRKGRQRDIEITAEDELGRMHRYEARPGILINPTAGYIEEKYLRQFGFSVAEDFSLMGEMNILLGTSVYELMRMIGSFFFGREPTVVGKKISFTGNNGAERIRLRTPHELYISEDISKLCSAVFIFDAERDRFTNSKMGECTIGIEKYFPSVDTVEKENLSRVKNIRLKYNGLVVLPEIGTIAEAERFTFRVDKSLLVFDSSGMYSAAEGKEIK